MTETQPLRIHTDEDPYKGKHVSKPFSKTRTLLSNREAIPERNKASMKIVQCLKILLSTREFILKTHTTKVKSKVKPLANVEP